MEAADSQAQPSVEFQATRDDFAAAYQLHFALTRGRWLFCALFVSASCAGMFFFLWHDNAPFWLQLLLPLAVASSGAIAGFFAWAVFAPWLGRRTHARQPLAHLPSRLTLRPDGLRLQSARGDSTLLWKDFIFWRANGKTTLVYLSPYSFLIVPARLSTQGFAADGLRAALTREIGPPRR
ncbi:MAG TPA: YcxB family protein [Hyphomicrobiaceae bacterium]|nr:YcxB family protein [Hyphomicrobiaceae bacterium]